MQQGLLSGYNPSDALPAPRYTGMLLPIERDMYGNKGNFELAVPQFLQDAYSGINKFGKVFRGELSPQEIQQLAFDTSMNVTGGSLLGSRLLPNAVPSGGILGMGVSNTPKQTGLLGKKTNRPNYEELRREANIQRFGYDPNEVVDTSYRMQHTPNPDGARLDDMTKAGEVFPDDIYSSNGLLYYGNPKSLADRQSFEVIQNVRGNPDAEVTIYRAVPNEDNIKTINSGDFVTLSEDYAKSHGASGYGVDGTEAGKILSQKVKVRDLFSEGNDLNEFGYFPSGEATTKTGLLGKVDNVQPKSGIAEVVPPTDKADGIMAFHGSPYDFNQFSLSRIDTGEGNQAFGYGLYFTDSKDIAKFYRNSLSDDVTSDTRFSYKGKEYERGSPEWKMLSTIYNEGKSSAKKLLDVFKSDLAKGEPYITSEKVKRYESIFNQSPKKSEISKNQGRIYEVKLNTVTQDLIDYDKPLTQQNDKIKSVLKPYYEYYQVKESADFSTLLENVYRHLPQDEFSERLAKEGIKGIKYLDNSARNTFGGKLLSVDKTSDGFKAKVVLDDLTRQTGVGGSGRVITTSQPYKTEKEARDWAKKSIEKDARNYVIFDDKIIDIMKKYGIVGAVGVTAMQGGNQSPEADLSL